MNSTSRLVVTSAAALAFTAAGVLPAFAETATINASARITPGTVMQVHPSSASGSVTGTVVRANAATPISIDDRIAMLQSLLARIGTLNVIPASAQARLKIAIQARIDQLEALKASGETTINPGTTNGVGPSASTGEHPTGAVSAAGFLSLVSKAAITTAADHILAVAGQLDNLSVKLDTRISAATSVDTSSLKATLADMKAKIADAKVQANAALTDVEGLDDSADASASASVAATLKDAAAKITVARTDIAAAFKDAMAIVTVIHGGGSGTPTTASANANVQ